MSLVHDYRKQAWEWFDRADRMPLGERSSALDIAAAWLRKALEANQNTEGHMKRKIGPRRKRALPHL
jgi:hypothetical protein